MKIRIRFAKGQDMRFIGHLDLMRYFQKCMRRANIDICYSQGFSPHQIMSFASPLGMGITSEGEYMDIEVNSSESSRRMIERLNQVMAKDMEILSWVKLPDEGKTNAMATIAAADYRVVLLPESLESFQKAGTGKTPTEAWQRFIAQPSIMIHKTTKKNELDIDIRPLIFRVDWMKDTAIMRISSGSSENLKPEAVMEAFFRWAGAELPEFGLQIHRLDMFARRGSRFVSLENLGEAIHE